MLEDVKRSLMEMCLCPVQPRISQGMNALGHRFGLGDPVSLPVKAVGGLAGVLYAGFEPLRKAVFPNSIYVSREMA